MKSAKKILLLVLSLVLLVGVFAFAALAEEDTATVVYPDGKTVSVAVGETIVPEAFTDGLYSGVAGTLYKDDATEGWTFTVDGAALTDLTVTAEMAGKQIVASGADQVYATLDLTITEGDYAIWLGGTQYVLAGTTTVSDGTELEAPTRKIPAGTYKFYYTQAADLQTLLSTADKMFEIDGVAYNYQDIRSRGNNVAKITLYADNTISGITWGKGDNDRSGTTLPAAGSAAAGMSYSAKVLLDLNGHTLVNARTSYTDVRSMYLHIYSSVPGAHYDASASGDAMFRSNNDTGICLGEDNDSSTNYHNNIYFHCKAVNVYLYGSGLSIAGGHYYQTATATGLVDVSRRTLLSGFDNDIVNASFYLLPGSTAVLNSTVAGAIKVKDCNFYTSDSAALLYTTTDKSVTVDGCGFYGVTVDSVAEGEVNVTLNATNNEEHAPVTYNTVTWYDGSTAYYYATTEAEAKAFVESHKKATVAPYGKMVDGVMYAVLNPSSAFAYDASFNATQSVVEDGLAKVYFAVEFENGDAIYYTDAATVGADFKAYIGAMKPGNSTIKLYQDIAVPGFGVNGAAASTYGLDLNGYTLTITSLKDKTAIDVFHTKFYIYSSVEGGVIDTSAVVSFFRTNDGWYGSEHNYGVLYLGEDNNSATDYSKNLTVYAQSLNVDMYGDRAYLYGGTYVQSENSGASCFLLMGRSGGTTSHIQDVKNVTIVLTNPLTVPMNLGCTAERTFTNCTFISANVTGGVALSSFTSYAYKNYFNNCNFVNVQPYAGSDYIVYDNSSFGTTGVFGTADVDVSDAVQYLAHGTTSKTITVLGETYVLDGVFTTADKALKLSWGESGTEYWMIGTKPARDAGTMTKREGGVLLTTPAFDLVSLNAIDENGIVTAAGEETVSVVFTGSEPLAFLYVDTKTGYEGYALVSECGDAIGIGNKFYELFNAPMSSYVITLYADMTISRGMAFGALASSEYNSLANGDITLDLNGCTLAVAENFANPIDPSNANTYNDYVDAVFAFEKANRKTFTITSSKAGAKIINPTIHSLIAVGEQDGANIVINGENIEVVSKGTILLHVEPASSINVNVNGGKYTYTGEYAAFSASGNPVFQNIVLVMANENAAAVFASPNYSHETVYTISNVEVYAAGRPDLYGFTTHNTVAITNSPARSNGFTVNVTDCVLAGVNLTKSYARTTVNFAGEIVAATAADLAAALPTAPEGKVAAYNVISYNGVAYTVISYAANAGLVDWGFGTQEYWVIGATATHADVTFNDVFTYSYEAFVVEGDTTAAPKLSVAPGAVQMYLVLQSKIGLNVLFSEALAGATVTIDGETFAIEELGYKLEKAIAPNKATGLVTIVIELDGNAHVLNVSVGKYAEVILGDEEFAPAHNLTYAMVEYVRAMANDIEFLADVVAPAGYEVEILDAREPANEGVLLESIAFQLDGTIAIAVHGTADANGKTVQLSLSNGRVVTATVVNGVAIFENLYVNEFLEEIQITIADETYNYDLSNYFYGLSDASEEVKADVQAFYNYAYHAHVYVKTLN